MTNGKIIFEGPVVINKLSLHIKFMGAKDGRKPVMVVVPGGPGFGLDLYQEKHEPFLENANILFYDPAGCGKSEKHNTPSQYSMDSNILDLHTLITHFRKMYPSLFSNGLCILGTSAGGMVALGYACGYGLDTIPDLNRLIIVSGAVHSGFIEEAKEILKTRGTAEQVEFCKKYLWPGKFDRESFSQYFKLMMGLYSYKMSQRSSIDNIYNFPCNLAVLNQILSTNYDKFDFTELLDKVTASIDWICGELDWITPPSHGRLCEEKAKRCHLKVLKKSSHAVTTDQPNIYRDIINKALLAVTHD